MIEVLTVLRSWSYQWDTCTREHSYFTNPTRLSRQEESAINHLKPGQDTSFQDTAWLRLTHTVHQRYTTVLSHMPHSMVFRSPQARPRKMLLSLTTNNSRHIVLYILPSSAVFPPKTGCMHHSKQVQDMRRKMNNSAMHTTPCIVFWHFSDRTLQTR